MRRNNETITDRDAMEQSNLVVEWKNTKRIAVLSMKNQQKEKCKKRSIIPCIFCFDTAIIRQATLIVKNQTFTRRKF